MSSTQKVPATMPPELGQSLGDRLKKSMRRRGLSVGDMAEFLEDHRNTISGWLADRSRPQRIFLRVWAEKVEVPLQWLVGGEWPTACPDFERPAPRARKAPVKRSSSAQKPRRGRARGA